jgi:hypothetical protein
MYRISELLQQLLCKELWDRGDVWPSALVALEGWLVWAIKYEDGMNCEGDETKEAVIEGAQSRIGAACTLLASLKHAHDIGVLPLLA